MVFVLSYDLKCLCCHSVHNFLHSDFYMKCVGIWNSPPYQISSASVQWFIICHTTEKLYVQFVHLVHSILTWVICNRSYILYFFINLCIVQQYIVLYLVLCLKVMWKPSWGFVTLISAGIVCFPATGFVILLEVTMTTYKSPVHFIHDKVGDTPYVAQLLFLWETIRLIWRRNMHH